MGSQNIIELMCFEEQLEFIRHLQMLRGPLYDAFFQFLNFFDTPVYYSALVAFIWVGISWKWGVRLGMLLILNGILNGLAKSFFAVPRPLFYDPSLGLVKVTGFSFPSGAAQASMLFGALLLYYWKSRWAAPCATFYVCLISFSRVFLGVHFPIDLLGGWLLGLFLMAAFVHYIHPIERVVSLRPQKTLLLTWGILFLAVVFLPPKIDRLLMIGAVVSLGVYWSTKYDLYLSGARNLNKKILHGIIGIAGAAILGLAVSRIVPSAFSFLAFALPGALWVSLLASPFCRRVCS